MFKIPVANSNPAPPTTRNSENRSSACANERSGGHSNSFGSTDHSLNSKIGTSVTPRVTCTPWVSR